MRHVWRRRLAVVALVVVAACGLLSVPVVPGHAQAALAAQLAVSDAGAAVTRVVPALGSHPAGACAGLEADFEVGNDVFKGDELGMYASVWPSVQALDALAVTSLLPGEEQCRRDFTENLAAIDVTYWDHYLPGFPPGYDQGPRALHVDSDLPRVDDSLWMGLALTWGYGRSGSPTLLRRAEDVFALARRDWDPRHGGVYWEEHAPGATDEAKSVVSNAPAVILGVQLYQRTHRRTYLTWSERIFDWLRAHLVNPATGLYEDSVDDATRPATVGATTYTYNQGVMVGAMVALSRVDPARYPLADAVRLAVRAMAYFAGHGTYGQPAFDVVWAENVLGLAGRYGNAAFAARARRSVRLAVRASPPRPGDLLDQGSELALGALTRLDRPDRPDRRAWEELPFAP
ncbi:MAG: glycoside hydrolase family 76 protein [Acidimicrobiales bacterium]